MKKLLPLLAFLIFASSATMAQVKPPNGMKELGAYSLFYENYKNEAYERAAEFGRWIWKGMPEKIEGYSRFELKKNLKRLAKVYSGIAEKKQDPSVKEAYMDTALTIYNKMFEKYPDAKDDHYNWYISRGRLYQKHASVIENASVKAAENYEKAFEMKPEEFTNYGNGYYIRVMLQEMIGQDKKDQALAVMKKAEPYASEKIKSAFNDMRNQLFDSPKERITFLEGQLKDNPENIEVLKALQDLYSEQEMVDKARKTSQKLYELNPNYENTLALAEFAMSNAKNKMAIKYLKEAMGKAKKDKQKAEISLDISGAYLNMEKLRDARKYARSASKYDNDWGKPYIQIADVYAQAVGKCTSGREMDSKDKAVYWIVLDYLNKAKRVDPNTASEVQRKAKSYEPVTPTNAEKHFWKPPLKNGEEFKIDSSLRKCYGWINETTKVR
ncbi:tetratricopeptide repeat protein [Fodinibius halophilus]|uniref:Tetratricopeptide repeat protein n=1 Tax=Fodinibius halophilus TaxID=1736908 RepID=A0A6M1T2R2_9BACT|nr:hypothetical protein [Fodinibius halophilus]NGP87525.1 hypothetical protein [Fodinibius halophilus]